MVRWGIIGAGHIAAKFAADFANCKNCELVAVASSSAERAEEFAETFKIPNFFGSYQEIFSVELDVIYIATPHTYHKEHTLLCLNHSVGVLCEKPFGMDYEEVSKMISVAKAKNIFLMEALWSMFLPAIQKTKELVSKKVIGDVCTIEADFGFLAPFDATSRLFDKKLGGGALLDIGIYPIFLALHLCGMPDEILATTIKGETGVDINTAIVFKYNSGAMASLNCTMLSNTNCEAQICGNLGRINIASRFHESQEISLLLNQQNSVTYDFGRETFGYDYEIEEVNKCILAGKTESEYMTHQFSLDLISLLDKTRAAAGIEY